MATAARAKKAATPGTSRGKSGKATKATKAARASRAGAETAASRARASKTNAKAKAKTVKKTAARKPSETRAGTSSTKPAAKKGKAAPLPPAYASGHYLIKSEPSVYPFRQLVADGRTAWEGVRNFEARNHLRSMKNGDTAFFYHSNEGKEIVGIARVVREAYQDPTTTEDWSVVDVEPVRALARPVTLSAIKADPFLSTMLLVRRSRISVVPMTEAEWNAVLAAADG